MQSADQFIALRRIFPCLISRTKNIPIEIKTAHTADTAVSGIGPRNEEHSGLTNANNREEVFGQKHISVTIFIN